MPIDQYTLDYLHHLSHVIQSLQERLHETEQRIQTLEGDLAQLKNDTKMNVGTIEYKFDQLKIERLEGTLNIGLTPKSGEGLFDDLNDLSIGDQPFQMDKGATMNASNGTMNPITETVTQRVEGYLQTDLVNDIKQMERKFDFPLDDNYRIFIIDDIRKQIPYRVTQLVDTLGQNPNQTSLPDGSQSLEDYLFETLQIEITTGIEKFIVNLKNGGIKG